MSIHPLLRFRQPEFILPALMASLLAAAGPGNAAPSAVFNVLDYGAQGNGAHNDTAAVQNAIDACAAAGGGQVLLPSGRVYLSGALTLRSGVDFHLAGGAILKGRPHWRDYGSAGALLFAKDAQGISVTGTGILDGNDRAVWQALADEEAGGNVLKEDWWPQAFTGDWWPFGKAPGAPQQGGGRPRMLLFINCERVRLQDATFRHAPSWTIHLVGCHEVALHSISIRNDWDVANNDGIDLDHCRDVRIANCYLECADDAIAIKNTPNFAAYGGSERITVTGCILASRSCALKVDEIYTPPGARDIVFANCIVSRSNRGLVIQSRDEGDIQNVLFANITVETGFSPHKWWGAAEPIHISHFPRTPQTRLGRVRNIRFNNILCRGENGVFLHGWTNRPLENIDLTHVRIEVAKTSGVPGGFYDLRPEGVFKGIFNSTLAGIYAREIKGLLLDHTAVVWGQPSDPAYGDGLDQDNIHDLQLNQVSLNSSPNASKPQAH